MAAQSKSTSKHRMASLDFLRFVAAFAVVMYHFQIGTHASAAGWSPAAVGVKLAEYGYLGVHLFFFISGYVILMSAWNRDVIAFVASRVSRIYPAFIPAVLLAATLRYLRPDYVGGIKLANVLANMTMLHELVNVSALDGVYWTLWVELRFYVLIAVLLHLGMTKGRILAFTCLWPFLGLVAMHHDWPFLQELLLAEHAPLFAAGMLLFLVVRDGWNLGAVLVMVVNVVLGAVNIQADAEALVRAGGHLIQPRYAVIFYLLAFVAVVLAATPVLGSFESRFLSWCGLLTYPLYLVHSAVGSFIFLEMPHASVLSKMVLGTTAALLTAIAFHYAFEKPWHKKVRVAVDRSLRAFVATPPSRTPAPQVVVRTTPADDDPRKVLAEV